MESMEGSLYLIVAIVAVLFVTFAAILSRYKRCPSDKILVVYGRTGKNATGGVSSARCIHGGAAFIWPVFQSYSFLDLTPISIECNLTNALSKQNIRVDVPCRFTVGISTEPDSMKCGRAFVGATAGKYSGFGQGYSFRAVTFGDCHDGY